MTTKDVIIRLTEEDIDKAFRVGIVYKDIERMAGGVDMVDALGTGDEGELVYILDDGRNARVYPPLGLQFGDGEGVDGVEFVTLAHLCGEVITIED